MNPSPSFHDLLASSDIPQQSVFDIVGRMHIMLEYFNTHDQHANLIPFLKTYYIVTREVITRSVQHEHYYDNPDALHQLDAYFASLYFTPLYNHLNGKTDLSPWQTYFEYCSIPRGNAFVQMLLGINAHINTDLALSLVYAHYTEEQDFYRIDQILSDVTPEVMRFLTVQNRDLFGLGGMLFPQLVQSQFEKTIMRWRADAWENAQFLRAHPQEMHVQRLKKKTEEIGRAIIDLFTQPAGLSKKRIMLQSLSATIGKM